MEKEKIREELLKLKSENNFRSLKEFGGKEINFSSNDYLGIAQDKKLLEEFYSKYNPKLSSSSSRLMSGSYTEVMELEKRAEEIYKKPCIVFNSGFDANSSILETFYGKNSLIITDRLNHASIYDGIINSGAEIIRYKHLDMENLEEILKKYSGKYSDILVVCETIYSMDGDITPIKEITELKKKYNFSLMIDEAHSYGVYGYGMAYNFNLVKDIDFLVIPLGKGGGSVGAFVFCEEILKKYIINKSRKFIFTTALPPANNMWNLFILNKMENEEFNKKRKILLERVNFTLKKLKDKGIKTNSTSHIISVVIGDNRKIIKIENNLRAKGYFISGIKEPTVPKNTARFRISLNPEISFKNIENFIEELKYELDTVF